MEGGDRDGSGLWNRGKRAVWGLASLFVLSFFYQYWMGLNLGPDTEQVLARYLTARCSSALHDEPEFKKRLLREESSAAELERLKSCQAITVKVIGSRGGMISNPMVKVRVNQPGKPDVIRYFSVTPPPWFGENNIRREVDYWYYTLTL